MESDVAASSWQLETSDGCFGIRHDCLQPWQHATCPAFFPAPLPQAGFYAQSATLFEACTPPESCRGVDLSGVDPSALSLSPFYDNKVGVARAVGVSVVCWCLLTHSRLKHPTRSASIRSAVLWNSPCARQPHLHLLAERSKHLPGKLSRRVDILRLAAVQHQQ